MPARHLLDPATGRPAYTGVVQATALAPTAAQAEAIAKAALLSGPARAAEWLSYGGVVVFDDGGYEVLEPAAAAPAPRPARPSSARRSPHRAASQPQISASTASRSGSFRISWSRPS
jgi:ApbE family